MKEDKKTQNRVGRRFTSEGMLISGAAIAVIICGVAISAVVMLILGILEGTPPTSDHIKDAPVNKNENVTVTTDAYGNATKVNDTVYITNNPEHKVLRDESILTNVSNKKQRANLPKKAEEGVLVWSAKGYDVSYQGEANPTNLPITMSVEYYFNEQPIDPEQLVGKTGDLKIVVKYNNTVNATLDDGTQIIVPYVAATFLLSTSDLTKIKCSTGKSINIGGNEVAMGVNAPGLQDLSGSKLFGVGTSETIFYGKITKFQGAQIKTLISGDLLANLDEKKLENLDLDSLVIKLGSAANTAIKKSDQFMPYLDIAGEYIPKVMDTSNKARTTTNKATDKIIDFIKKLDENFNTVDGVSNLYQSFIDMIYKDLYGDETSNDATEVPIDESLEDMGDAVDGVVDELGQSLGLLKKAKDSASSDSDKKLYDDQMKDICNSIFELDPDSTYLNGYESYLSEEQKQIRANNNDGKGGVIDEYNRSKKTLEDYEKIYNDPKYVEDYFKNTRKELEESISKELDPTKKEKLQKQLDNLNKYESKAKKEDGTYYTLAELDTKGVEAKEVIAYIIESNITPEQKEAIINKLEQANGFVNKIDDLIQKYGKQAPGIIKQIKKIKKQVDNIYYNQFLKYLGIYNSNLKGTADALEKTIEGHRKVANFSGLSEGWTGTTTYTFNVSFGQDRSILELLNEEGVLNGNKE